MPSSAPATTSSARPVSVGRPVSPGTSSAVAAVVSTTSSRRSSGAGPLAGNGDPRGRRGVRTSRWLPISSSSRRCSAPTCPSPPARPCPAMRAAPPAQHPVHRPLAAVAARARGRCAGFARACSARWSRVARAASAVASVRRLRRRVEPAVARVGSSRTARTTWTSPPGWTTGPRSGSPVGVRQVLAAAARATSMCTCASPARPFRA